MTKRLVQAKVDEAKSVDACAAEAGYEYEVQGERVTLAGYPDSFQGYLVSAPPMSEVVGVM